MNCVYRQQLCEVFPSTCSNILYTIICFTVFDLAPSLLASDQAFGGFSKGLQDDQSECVAGIGIKIRIHLEQ